MNNSVASDRLGKLALKSGAHILITPVRRGNTWVDDWNIRAEGRMGRGGYKELEFRSENGVMLITLKGRFSQATTCRLPEFFAWTDSLPVLCEMPHQPLQPASAEQETRVREHLHQYYSRGGEDGGSVSR